jgi:hypothetical protein
MNAEPATLLQKARASLRTARLLANQGYYDFAVLADISSIQTACPGSTTAISSKGKKAVMSATMILSQG